jgi:hypothetical protein
VDSDWADAVVAEVNAFVARHLWMDFSVWSFQGVELEVSGTRDESYWSDLRVVFTGVCWACIRFQGWSSDTARPVLARVTDAEEYAVNSRFQVEVGHHLFRFVASDFAEPMWIAARAIAADFTRLDFGAGQGE